MRGKSPEFLHVRWTNLMQNVELYRNEVLERAAEHAGCFPEVQVWWEGNGSVPVAMRQISRRIFFLPGRGLFRSVGGASFPLLPLVRPDGPLENVAHGDHKELWEALFRHENCQVPDPATEPL